MNIKYWIDYEIWGREAHYSRPDSGDSPVSYSAPTYSAVKGTTEAVLFNPHVIVIPKQVEICKPIKFYSHTENYRGPCRKRDNINKGSSNQKTWLSLYDVVYKIHCAVINKQPKTTKNNVAHQYQDQFNRCIKRGSFNSTPFLGLRNMIPSYFGPIRNDTSACKNLTLSIPTMFKMFEDYASTDEERKNVVIVDSSKDSRFDGRVMFYKNVEIINGVMRYD